MATSASSVPCGTACAPCLTSSQSSSVNRPSAAAGITSATRPATWTLPACVRTRGVGSNRARR
jgi:hypothetical protein